MTGEQRGRNQQGEPDQLDTPAFFLAHPHPTRNDRKAVFPVFVSCFRFFRRGGMFHDCSVSAAVTHLVSCGGGYAGLPDTCMRASLTAAVSWLACLVRCPDICTLPACPARQNLHTQVDRGWSERGNLTLCENLGKVDRRTIRYNEHTASSASSNSCSCTSDYARCSRPRPRGLTEGEAINSLVRHADRCNARWTDGLGNVEAGAWGDGDGREGRRGGRKSKESSLKVTLHAA